MKIRVPDRPARLFSAVFPKKGDFYTLSEGEFILTVAELLSQRRAAIPREIEHWRRYLNGNPRKRVRLVRKFINGEINRQRHDEQLVDPYHPWIMGTKQFLTPAVWKNRIAELDLALPSQGLQTPISTSHAGRPTGSYIVSAIASLYRGRRFIENFLDNITSQSIFDRCELIIVDANSPEREEEIIAKYQKVHPNIIYRRINYRIGVYDAWNVGVELAHGKYLTNTNLDDLRRCDSFEIQARALDRHSSVDVVYQDFYYTFDPSLSFDQVANLGFKSELPIVTAHNLLMFNSPHNAPMWRRTLHDELGLFDTSFKSAGDWEFWLRCIWRGKRFFKINEPHVVYYQNPHGVSTRPDTRGIDEGRQVLNRYSRRLISSRLLLSHQEFAELLGIAPYWDRAMSYYDVVQGQLKYLGEQYKRKNLGKKY